MPGLSPRRGAAMPIVIIVAAALTVALAAAFALNATEVRVNDDQQEQVKAFSLAESGREHFLANRTALGFTSAPPAVSESTRVILTEGYADVVLQQLRPAVAKDPAVYVLRSRGVRTRTSFPGAPPAQRTVAHYLYWQTASMDVLAGWTSLSGLNKNGNSGTLSGNDQCLPAAPAVAGVSVANPPGYTGHTNPASGSPPIQNLGDAATAAAAVKIDWAGIVNGTALQPTISIPPSAWPSFSDPNFWPVIKVTGDFSLPGSGRGTLIVTGNLTISGGQNWEGVVLVGNNLTSNGDNGVAGATVTGLNVKLGQSVPKADIANGTKIYRYNSCHVARAMAAVITPALIPFANTWMDNWASY